MICTVKVGRFGNSILTEMRPDVCFSFSFRQKMWIRELRGDKEGVELKPTKDRLLVQELFNSTTALKLVEKERL